MANNFKHFKILSITEIKSDIDNMESLSENDLVVLYSAIEHSAKFYYDKILGEKPPFKVLSDDFIKTDTMSKIREAYNFALEYYEVCTKQVRAMRLSSKPRLNNPSE